MLTAPSEGMGGSRGVRTEDLLTPSSPPGAAAAAAAPLLFSDGGTRQWVNPSFGSMDDIGQAMLLLLVCATGDDWDQVMYWAMDSMLYMLMQSWDQVMCVYWAMDLPPTSYLLPGHVLGDGLRSWA